VTITSRTRRRSRRPSAPPGWRRAKSSRPNPRRCRSATASASPIASAAVVEEVGARSCGHASSPTEQSSTSRCAAPARSPARPVIATCYPLRPEELQQPAELVRTRRSWRAGSPRRRDPRCPRSPCSASTGWRKVAGVPVEVSVAAILRPRSPTCRPRRRSRARGREDRLDRPDERSSEPGLQRRDRRGLHAEHARAPSPPRSRPAIVRPSAGGDRPLPGCGHHAAASRSRTYAPPLRPLAARGAAPRRTRGPRRGRRAARRPSGSAAPRGRVADAAGSPRAAAPPGPAGRRRGTRLLPAGPARSGSPHDRELGGVRSWCTRRSPAPRRAAAPPPTRGR
jgi:hypothetical protein